MNLMWSTAAKSDLLGLYEHMKQINEHQAFKSLSVLRESPWSLMPDYATECRILGFPSRDIRKADVGGFEITYEVRKDSLVILLIELKHQYLFHEKSEAVYKSM